jgi:hypothetical protein
MLSEIYVSKSSGTEFDLGAARREVIYGAAASFLRSLQEFSQQGVVETFSDPGSETLEESHPVAVWSALSFKSTAVLPLDTGIGGLIAKAGPPEPSRWLTLLYWNEGEPFVSSPEIQSSTILRLSTDDRLTTAANPDEWTPLWEWAQARVRRLSAEVGTGLLRAYVAQDVVRPEVNPHWLHQVGPLLTEDSVEARLALTAREIAQRLDDNSLLAVQDRRGRLFFPAFQFRNGDMQDALQAVLSQLLPATADNWTVASWFRSPHPLLDNRTPAEWLDEGADTEQLLEAARRDAARLGQ